MLRSWYFLVSNFKWVFLSFTMTHIISLEAISAASTPVALDFTSEKSVKASSAVALLL